MRNMIKLSVRMGCLLIMFSYSLYGQVKIRYLPADTLLRWFENAPNPTVVWDSIDVWRDGVSGIGRFDYEAYYHSAKLKPYLLKWLDRDMKVQLRLKELRASYFPDSKEDSVYITYKIKGRLKKQNRENRLETILHTPELYSSYTDSILNKIIERKVNEFEKKGEPYPDWRNISFHMRLAYPESYELIREFWEETGKGTESNRFFIPLVYMGDPEAREIYDQYIEEVVKTNGKNVPLIGVLGLLNSELRGSYGTAKAIELLEVDQMIDLFGFGDPDDIIPYKCRVMGLLISDIFQHNIEVDSVVIYRDSCEKHFEHLEKIKEAAQRLIEYYKKKNHYWMKNMPFYKGK